MAKKNETEIEGYNKEVGGPGWKRCPQCEGFVKGPLTKECPACHHKFTFKSKMIAKPVAGARSREEELEQTGMLLALRLGGIDGVIKALDKVKASPEIAFAIKCGGVENAKAVLSAIQAKVSGHENNG